MASALRVLRVRLRSSDFNLAAALVALLLVAGWLQPPGLAQASDADGEAGSPQAREQLYQELEREVAALERQGNLLKKIVRLVKPTVVHIDAEKSAGGNASYGRGSREETGSGVVIRLEEKFYVLTNRHVIKDSPLPRIKLKLADGRSLSPTQVWSDAETDVALLGVSASDLIPARLADSDRVEIGDFVLAVGSPFGLSHSVTYGIISAKGRRDLKLGDGSIHYQDFLQTDAAINPGNSGGPLLNLRGEVIGINTAIASNSGGSEGIGFTIPIDMAMSVARQLAQHGRVDRAYLGVRLDGSFTTATARRLGLAHNQGACVTAVVPESPAERARFQVDDVILQFDGVPIRDDNHLINRVSLTPVDKQVRVVVHRQGQPVTLQVRVQPHPNR